MSEALRTPGFATCGEVGARFAPKLKLSRATVSKFVEAQEYPEMHHPNGGARWSLLDPYKRYLLQRWQQGCRNSVQLYDEITARGYIRNGWSSGGRTLMYCGCAFSVACRDTLILAGSLLFEHIR